MLNAFESESDMEVSFSDTDTGLENENLRRTSRIRYSSRKMLEAQALLKDKPKITKSEFAHTQRNVEVCSLIYRRRSLDDAINMNEVDIRKQLNVNNVKENTIAGSNSIEHLVISEKLVESKPSKSKVKRSNSLDSSTSKMKIINFNSHNKIESEIISCLDNSKDNIEGNKEKAMDSLQVLNKNVPKSFKRKLETDQIIFQKTRKKLKPSKSIKTIKLSKTLKSDDGDNKKKKVVIKKQSTKAKNKKELPSKMNKESKKICFSPELNFTETLYNDQSSKEDSSVIAVDFNKVDNSQQNDQHTSSNVVENCDNDGKVKKEILRSLRMKNDCYVAEDELLLDHLAINMNNRINNKVKTEKKRPKKKSKVSVSQVKLDKIKLMNDKNKIKNGINAQLKVNKKVFKPPVKDCNNYKKSVKAKQIGASSIMKKKFRTFYNVTASNKKTKQKSVIASTQNVIENHNQEDSCKSLIITEFSSLLSKYGAIRLSATKKKLGIVPNSFLNLELVTAAINCQYFGFQEVFDWISRCLKLKNVSLTQMVEKQFKLFEQFFIHMSKSIMTDEDEDEWSKLRVKYYNLPVNSQTSWELVFGYTPKFCNNINLDSSLRKTTSDLQEESNKESIDISLNGFKMEITEKKYRPNRKTKTDNTVVITALNTKDNLKTKIPVVKILTDDTVISTELNTKDNLRTKIPMVKIYGYIPEVSTKKAITKLNCIDIKLKNNCSSKIKNKRDRTSCIKNINNRGKPIFEKLCHKNENKKTKGKRIQLKDTLWNSKKKMVEKINKKCEIETEDYCKITPEDNTQKNKLKLIETPENPETKAEVNYQNSIKFEHHENTIANNDIRNNDSTSSNDKLGCKASQTTDLQPRKVLKENFLEKSLKKGSIGNKVEKLPQIQQLPLAKETVKVDDSHYSNIKEIALPKKDKCKNRKLDNELAKEKNKEIECNDANVESNEKHLQPSLIYLRKTHKEKCLEKNSENGSIDNKVEELPQTHQLHISMEAVKTDNPHFSDIKEIDIPKKYKCKNKNLDIELSKEKIKEIKCSNVNVDSNEKSLQPTTMNSRKNQKEKCLEKKSEKASIKNKVEKFPQTHRPHIFKETVKTDDPHVSNMIEIDLPKKGKFKNKKLDKELSKGKLKEIECNNVNVESNVKLLQPTPIYLRKTHKEKCLEEKSEKRSIDNKVDKLPQTHELAFFKETVKTDDSHFSNIKEINLPKKNECENRKLDEELSKEKDEEIEFNNVIVVRNEKDMIKLKENTGNDRSSISLPEKPQCFTQSQVIPTLINYFRRKDITNIDIVFETLMLIHVKVTNAFCEKHILNLSKDFVQKNKDDDNHNDGSHLHYKHDGLDFAITNNKFPLEAHERHFKRSVRIVKADEIVTCRNIGANEMLTSVSSVDLNKNSFTIDPKESVISRFHESLHVTISDIPSDHESPHKTSEIISHESPLKKLSESCTCCKSLSDIKSQLEKLFCNKLEYEQSLDGDQNMNVQGKSSMEEREIQFQPPKNILIDNCMQQNVFLKQNLYHIKNIHKSDIEKLTESYVCELEKREENHKEYRSKCVEDTDKLQTQIKDLEKLNEFILIEKKSELEKQSKSLMEEHNQELEKLTEGHGVQLKNIEASETYICELETQKENLEEQKIKLEEDTIKLQTQIMDLEKLNESILIDKKKELENQHKKLTEEHNQDLDKQRERHISHLKKLEEHKQHLKGQLNEKNKIISKKIQNKKYHASAANISLKRTNFDENRKVSKFLKLESDIAYQSVDICKGKNVLKEKLEKLTAYRPESSCDIVAKIAKHSDNRINVKSQISSLNDEQKNNQGNLTSLAPFTVNCNSFSISPSTPLTPQPFKCTTEVVDLSPSKDTFSISSEKKKINVEEYRLRNCKKLSNDREEYNKCLTFIRHDNSLDSDYSETKSFEESIQEYDYNENSCKMCEGFKKENEGYTKECEGYKKECEGYKKECEGYKKENEGYKKECEKYKKELEELTCELQEFKENRSEKDNDVNTMKADMYNRYHVMKSSFEDTNNSMKSNIEDLMKSNQQLKTENVNLIKNCDDMKYEKKEQGKLYDDFKEIDEKKHIEYEIAKENVRKQFEKVLYENKLLKKEMEKLNIDLGNSKFKFSAEQTRFQKEIELKENYINQLQRNNVKKDELLIDKEIVIQRLTLIEKRYLDLIKDKQMYTENLDNVCKNSEKLDEIEKKITKKDEYIDEIKTINEDCMDELIISSPEEDAQNGNNINVRKKFRQLEKNSATINDKMKQMSFKMTQNKKEKEKLEATTKELKILLLEEQSKVKLLETKQENLQKQQLGCAINHKNHLEDFDKKKIKDLQPKRVKHFESLEIERKVSIKIKRTIRNKSKMQLKMDEQKHEIIKLSNSFEKEKEAAEYYGMHLYYQRSRNALLEERLSALYRDNLRELSLQLCQFDGAAERYKCIMNNLADLNMNNPADLNMNNLADLTKNHEHSGDLVVRDEGLDLSALNFLPEIAVMEKQPVDLDTDEVQDI